MKVPTHLAVLLWSIPVTSTPPQHDRDATPNRTPQPTIGLSTRSRQFSTTLHAGDPSIVAGVTRSTFTPSPPFSSAYRVPQFYTGHRCKRIITTAATLCPASQLSVTSPLHAYVAPGFATCRLYALFYTNALQPFTVHSMYALPGDPSGSVK